MTPAEHYERAEELLEAARGASDPLTASRLVNVASVHATLAAVPWGGSEDVVDDELVDVLRELNRWAHTAATVPVVRGAITSGADYAEGHVDGDESARRLVASLVDPVLATLEAPRQ